MQTLNRLACMFIAPFRHSTPTKGLEIMLDIEPLETYIEKEGLKAFIRNKAHKQVHWDGLMRPDNGLSRLRRHLAVWERKAKEAGLMDWPLDVMTSRLCTIKSYKTDLESSARKKSTMMT